MIMPSVFSTKPEPELSPLDASTRIVTVLGSTLAATAAPTAWPGCWLGDGDSPDGGAPVLPPSLRPNRADPARLVPPPTITAVTAATPAVARKCRRFERPRPRSEERRVGKEGRSRR